MLHSLAHTFMLHSHVTCAFAFFFDLCRPVLENTNVKCEHNHLLPQNPFSKLDGNADFTREQVLKANVVFTYSYELNEIYCSQIWPSWRAKLVIMRKKICFYSRKWRNLNHRFVQSQIHSIQLKVTDEFKGVEYSSVFSLHFIHDGDFISVC